MGRGRGVSYFYFLIFSIFGFFFDGSWKNRKKKFYDCVTLFNNVGNGFMKEENKETKINVKMYMRYFFVLYISNL